MSVHFVYPNVIPHEKLFWVPMPNTRKVYFNVTMTINSNGHRGYNITSKKSNEYRILSLGESTTFGIGVEDNETYSFLLQKKLNTKNSSKYFFNVLNAGVSAYSSFQSLKYPRNHS